MTRFGFVAVAALVSGTASAETVNIPIGGGTARIVVRECQSGKVCADLSWSDGRSRFAGQTVTVDKSIIERFIPQPKADNTRPLPNAPALMAGQPARAAPPPPAVQAPPAQPQVAAAAAATAAPREALPAPQPTGRPQQAGQPTSHERPVIVADPAPARHDEPPPLVTGRPDQQLPSQAAAPVPKATTSLSPVGDWLTENGEGRIRIQECGANLCGYIATVKDPNEKDSKNPDPTLRNRPMLGLPILIDMKPTRANRWDGKIYNTRNGSTYTSHISLRNSGTLRVEGCLMMFCGGQNWTRAE